MGYAFTTFLVGYPNFIWARRLAPLPKKSLNCEFQGLTIARFRLRIPPIPAKIFRAARAREIKDPECMISTRPSMSPSRLSSELPEKSKHPRVRIVAREEDAEFVECLECSEVFESSEFKDMVIEETKLANEG
jgi:seryl-tRNA(Sec) selenium transferase